MAANKNGANNRAQTRERPKISGKMEDIDK